MGHLLMHIILGFLEFLLDLPLPDTLKYVIYMVTIYTRRSFEERFRIQLFCALHLSCARGASPHLYPLRYKLSSGSRDWMGGEKATKHEIPMVLSICVPWIRYLKLTNICTSISVLALFSQNTRSKFAKNCKTSQTRLFFLSTSNLQLKTFLAQ